MSSVTTAILADIQRQFGAGISRLQAKHQDELQSDIAKLKADLEAQLGRVGGLANKMAQPAKAVAEVKVAPLATHTNGSAKKAAPKRKSKGVIKYRDPANPEKGWTGRGKQPNWFKAGIAAGKTPEAFAVA